jgi:hypothetical protein
VWMCVCVCEGGGRCKPSFAADWLADIPNHTHSAGAVYAFFV